MEQIWGRYWSWEASGGIGKSTLAANLAVLAARAGGDVLLIDADPQETTATWAQARADQTGELAPVTTVTIVGKQIREELKRLAAKYRTIIVDAGARDTTTQRAALSVASLVLLPFPPRGPDLWTLDAVAQTVAEVRTINDGLRAVAFVNRADPVGDDNAEAEAAFAEHAEVIEAVPIRSATARASPSPISWGWRPLKPTPRRQGRGRAGCTVPVRSRYRQCTVTVQERCIDEQSSKFARPQGREPTPTEIEQVISKAETRDEPAGAAPESRSALYPRPAVRHGGSRRCRAQGGRRHGTARLDPAGDRREAGPGRDMTVSAEYSLPVLERCILNTVTSPPRYHTVDLPGGGSSITQPV